MDGNFDLSSVVYTPSDVATYTLNGVKALQESEQFAVPTGIPLLDDYFAPVRPGQVAILLGQTSHGKSLLMKQIEFNVARKILESGKDNQIIVHVSLEDGIEEQGFMEVSRFSKESPSNLAIGRVKDWGELTEASYKVAGLPIYRIGDSLGRDEDIPRLYLTNIIRAIDYVVSKFNVTIAMIGIDYLQALPLDPDGPKTDYETARRLQVRADAYRIRGLASRYKCPVWLAAQAKQILSSTPQNTNGKQADGPKPLQIPGQYDINESADPAQRADRILSVWMPKQTYPNGTLLAFGNKQIKVTDNLMLLKVAKQRGGLPAGRVYICNIDYSTNTITPIEFEGGDGRPSPDKSSRLWD